MTRYTVTLDLNRYPREENIVMRCATQHGCKPQQELVSMITA